MGCKRMLLAENLSTVIEKIHEAALDLSAWPDVLQGIGDLFQSSSVHVWVQDSIGNIQSMQGLQQAEEITREYSEYYWRLDLLRRAVMREPVGTPLVAEMVITREAFLKTEFYADFAQPHDLVDCMHTRLFDGAGCSGYLSIGRMDKIGAFEPEEIRVARLLIPHLRGAQRTREQLAFANLERASVLATLDALNQGVLIIDAEMRVRHANATARLLLCMADGLTTTAQGQLRAMHLDDEARLRRALGRAGGNGGSTLAIARPSGRTPFAVTVQPIAATSITISDLRCIGQRPTAIVFVVAADCDGVATAVASTLRVVYGLTTAEAAVAETLAQGKGTKDAANALGVAPSTVRWHLQRVFEKTGTTRQAELARLVERLGAVAGDEDRAPP